MPTLDWLTRREDEQTAGKAPYRLLVPVDDAGLLTLDDLLVLAYHAQASASVRCSAAQALSRLGRVDEATTILIALASDAQVSASIRSTAAQELGRLRRADEAATILIALACDAQVNAGVRSAAAQALGELGRTDEAVEILVGLARDPQVDALIHRTAASAPGVLDHADNTLVAGLFSLVRDPQVDVDARSAAAQILGEQGFVDEVSSILLTLAHDPWLSTEIGSPAYVLGQFGRADQTIVTGLLALARDEQVAAGVRRDAYQSLKRLQAG
jgi:uncharacterized protein (UPF0147 family)